MKTTLSPRVSHANSSQSPHANQQFDPWIIWVACRRCWIWALPVGIVMACLVAYVVSETFVPRYQATHLLVANDDFVAFQGVMPVVKNLARSETPLMLNSLILDTILVDPKYRSAPSLSDPETAEENLRKNLKIRSAGDESQLAVTYEDSSPEAAALVCNGVVEEYLKLRDSFDQKRVTKWEQQLDPEIANWQRIVENHRNRVTEFYVEIYGYAPSDENSEFENKSELSNITRMRYEIKNLELEIFLEKARINNQAEGEAAIKESEMSSDSDPAVPVHRNAPTEFQIDAEVDNDPDVMRARQLVQLYESSIRQKELGGNSRLDDVRRLKGDLDQAEKSLVSLKAEVRPRVEVELNKLADDDYDRRYTNAVSQQKFDLQVLKQEQASELAGRLARDRGLLKDSESRLAFLKQQYEVERSQARKVGTDTVDLQFAQGDLDTANGVLKTLNSRAAAVRTERGQAGAVESLARATPPRSPIEKLPYKFIVLASLVALMIPFSFGLLWEVRMQRLTDSEMCDKNGLTVIGEIARLPHGAHSANGRRVFEESIDTLRSSLSLSLDTKDARTIAVVSSMTGEGKSSVSSQLALSIAKSTGETVLLVDADLRCPDQHDIFGLDIGPGLSAVLSDAVSLAEATDKSLGDLIHVLPAGRLSSSPHRLITPEKIKAFIEDALKQYRYVVLDTAPILAAGESLAVAAVADVTLLCVMRDVSRVDNVARATRRLEAAGATLAGTVFSGVSPRQYAYRYGNYHYGLPELDSPSSGG